VVLVALLATPAHVSVRHATRHETDAPHVDVRLGQNGEAIDRANPDVAVRPQHTSRFTEHRLRIRAMLDRPHGRDATEGGIGEWKMLGVAANELDGNTGQLGTPARHDEPSQRDVDANGTDSTLRDDAGEIAGPRAYVEPRP
jgi:hypothetical protein